MPKPHRIAVLAVDHGALFELGCAVELFGLPRPEYENWYECEVVTFQEPELSYTANTILKARKVRTLDRYDTLVIPSWNPDARCLESGLASNLKNAIVKFHQRGKRILSFCSGAFLLGHLGILDGKSATTHWRYAEKFQRLFPHSSYVDDVLYVYDGQIGCSAGSAAGLDLGIAVIREDFGYKIANQVARRLVLSAHRNGGQSQFVDTPLLRAPGKFSEALDWGVENLSNIDNVSVIADRARMSRRTFDRKFRATLGVSPNDWLIDQRLLLAKTLLEEHHDGIDVIAESAGFGSTVTMRYHFNRKFGITPTQYRSQFRKQATLS